MAVKLPLKMPDGTAVRTIEELREHFDLRTVLDYYSSGRLTEWLEDRYYDEEAKKVSKLDLASEKFKEELCAILGVPYMERMDTRIDVGDIVKKNERREHLKEYTTDDTILASADNVAFTQKELAGLLKRLDSLEVDDEGNRMIFLCGEHFIIPAKVSGVIYRGVNNPTVEFDNEVVEAGIDFQDLEVDLKDDGDFKAFRDMFYHTFDNNPILGAKLLRIAAEKEAVKAQTVLGECYRNGFGVEQNAEEAEKWVRKAAEQGNADAQYELGQWYLDGDDEEAAEKWVRKAAEQGHMDAQCELGEWYSYDDDDSHEAEKWYRRAAEQGNADAQYELGQWYSRGDEQNAEEAEKWYRKAAEQGHWEARKKLGLKNNSGLFNIVDRLLKGQNE